MYDNTFQLGYPQTITDNKIKFNYIIAHLPPEAAAIVRDVIMNFDIISLKNGNSGFDKTSSHQDIRKLLLGDENGDRHLSELLCVMRRLKGSHSVPDEVTRAFPAASAYVSAI
ncbi:transposon Tf2-9 polyprotein [Trichonephila inaurata madagascariensis]|uniref:Transposon Tf2-9 polyprotein n=1 Tax=Trichonephila inaurata madagascariensis TaxID=2747483 RepID=A0A8X6X595_9ARAC|nr:transposon Tf2-9 polyprotein [Trichonephila inaurata madagascariensis]